MGGKRTTHHHGNLAQAVVERALEAAQLGTIEAMSLREISRDLGVSPGAIYRHFPDKDALLRTLAQLGFGRLAEAFESAVPFNSGAKNAKDARARFVRLATCYVAFAHRHYGLWRLMFGPYGLDPDRAPETRPSTYAWLANSLDEMARLKLIRQPTPDMQYFAWTAIHGLSDLQASPAIANTPTPEAVIETQCQLILTALATDGKANARSPRDHSNGPR